MYFITSADAQQRLRPNLSMGARTPVISTHSLLGPVAIIKLQMTVQSWSKIKSEAHIRQRTPMAPNSKNIGSFTTDQFLAEVKIKLLSHRRKSETISIRK